MQNIKNKFGHFFLKVTALFYTAAKAITGGEKGWLMSLWNTTFKKDAVKRIGRDRSLILGGISKCECGFPGGVFINGWLLPRCNYDKVLVYKGDELLGSARLRRHRPDIYRRYMTFNDRSSGWDFFVEDPTQLIDVDEIKIVVEKDQNEIMTRYKRIDRSTTLEASVEEVKSCKRIANTRNILVPGLHNRLLLNAKLAEQLPEYQFVFFVEGMPATLQGALKEVKRETGVSTQALETLQLFMLPQIFQRNQYFYTENAVQITEEMHAVFNAHPYLTEAAENQQEKYTSRGMPEGYGKYYVYHVYRYFDEILSCVKPEAVLLWNRFYPLHLVIDHMCKERGISTIYYEGGLLPGTIVFETEGQMGESWPANDFDQFRELSLERQELLSANRIWDYLYEGKLNSRYPPKSQIYKERLREQLKPGRPTIFYAGQNDFESGLFPYTEHTWQYHSPVFSSSRDVLFFLAELAEKNNWNLVYKCHPMMRPIEEGLDLPKNVISNYDIDIHDVVDVADLTVTILSQSAYVSLIRHKPVLMLGYNQLRGKGCTYEAYAKEDIEPTICQALDRGFMLEQRQAFTRHIAQLLRYYLYDDFTIFKSIQFGKNIEQCADFFRRVIEDDTRRRKMEAKGWGVR